MKVIKAADFKLLSMHFIGQEEEMWGKQCLYVLMGIYISGLYQTTT
jgi:hypothetical protein